MKLYKFFIVFISFSMIFYLHAQDLQENGIEFDCDDIENTTGYYWPKTNNNGSFAYIDDILYSNIIELQDKIESTTADYLGHFIDKESKKVYLYGQIDETSQEEDYDDEIYDDEENENEADY